MNYLRVKFLYEQIIGKMFLKNKGGQTAGEQKQERCEEELMNVPIAVVLRCPKAR